MALEVRLAELREGIRLALSEELSRLYESHYVIDPRDTRTWLARVLDVHRMRMTNGVGKHRLANWPTSY